jgi:hypothetical protein
LVVLLGVGYVALVSSPDFQQSYSDSRVQYQYDRIFQEHNKALTEDRARFQACTEINCAHGQADLVLGDVRSYRSALSRRRVPACLLGTDQQIHAALDDYEAYYNAALNASSIDVFAAASERLRAAEREQASAQRLLDSRPCTPVA